MCLQPRLSALYGVYMWKSIYIKYRFISNSVQSMFSSEMCVLFSLLELFFIYVY